MTEDDILDSCTASSASRAMLWVSGQFSSRRMRVATVVQVGTAMLTYFGSVVAVIIVVVTHLYNRRNNVVGHNGKGGILCCIDRIHVLVPLAP